jgi:hypothetical protein
MLLAVSVALLLSASHLLAIHEGPAWTSPLLIGDHLFDLGFALMMLLYALALGRKIARPLLGLSDDPLSEGLAALGLGLCALSLAILFAGFARLYYGAVFLALWVATTTWLRHELAAILQTGGERVVQWCRAGMPTAPTLGQRLVLLLLIPTLLILAVRATVPVSPNVSGTEWDALAYHLSAQNIYVMEHRFVPLPDIPLANAPSGGDALLIPGLLAGTDIMGKWLNLLCALLLGGATYALGRRLFSPRGAWLGVLLLFNTIWLVPIMPTTMPDFAAAFLLVLGIADGLAWLDRRREIELRDAHTHTGTLRPRVDLVRDGDRLLLRAGLLLGGAVSFKLTNLPIIPAAIGTLGISCLAMRGLVQARVSDAARACAILCVGALIPLGPWLIKSLYFFHNALYPTGVAVAGQVTNNGVGPAATVTYQAPLEHLWWIIHTYASVLWQFGSPMAVLLLLAPCVVRTRSGRGAVLLIVLAGMLWLAFIPLYLPPRYWIGLIAVADALIAGTVWTLLENRLSPLPRLAIACMLLVSGTLWLANVPFSAPTPFWHTVVLAGEAIVILLLVTISRKRTRLFLLEAPLVAFLCITCALNVFLELNEMSKDHAVAVAEGALSRDAYLRSFLGGFYATEQFVNAELPPNAHIAMVHVTLGYYAQRNYLSDWYGSIFAQLQSSDAARRGEMAAWCRGGVGYAIFNRGPEEQGDDPRVHPLSYFAWTRMPGLQPRVLFSAGGIDVLSIHPCAVSSTGS